MVTLMKLAALQIDIARARVLGDQAAAIEDALEVGRLRADRGNLSDALQLFRQAAAQAEQLGDRVLTARSNQLLAAVAIRREDFEPARTLLVSAVPVLRSGNEPRLTLDALLRLALVEDKLGNEVASAAAFREAAQIAKSIGDTERAIWALGDCGGIPYRQGRYEQAEPYWAEALELSTRSRKRAHQAKYMYFLGVVRYRLNQRDSAMSLLQDSEKLYNRLGMHALADRAAEDLAAIEAERLPQPPSSAGG
jgi:tetratricopeptide (TPR) repeat protein